MASMNEARRTIAEGGAYVNNERVTDAEAQVDPSALLHGRYLVLRRGRRTFAGVELPPNAVPPSRATASTRPSRVDQADAGELISSRRHPPLIDEVGHGSMAESVDTSGIVPTRAPWMAGTSRDAPLGAAEHSCSSRTTSLDQG